MIIELGHFALMLALSLALIQATVPLWGARRRHAGMMALGDMTALAQFGLIALALVMTRNPTINLSSASVA